MPVDDQRAYAAPSQLIGEHQPGWTGSNDKNVGLHGGPPWANLLKNEAARF
jgi:hypothetical protein